MNNLYYLSRYRNYYNDLEWKNVDIDYKQVFDLSTITYRELNLKITISDNERWFFDFKSFIKDIIFNKYLSLYFSFYWTSDLIKYGILIHDNTIQLHSCTVNGNEFDKSWISMYYR